MRKLVYYVAVSLDGYIAGPNGEFDFYPVSGELTAWAGERYPESVPTFLRGTVGLAEDAPNREWDTVVMGRGSYEPALAAGVTSPYSHMKQYVCSTTLAPGGDPRVEIVGTDPVELIRRLKSEPGKDIWLCGGSALAGTLAGEIDRLIIKSYPVIAGAGKPMIDGEFRPAQFTVTARESFANGAQVTILERN